MAKATALWLIENTKLTFQQIASFCDMHVLQIETLANGEGGIVSIDPVILGQITQEEIYRCETDPSATLVMVNRVTASSKKKARYVSLANRKEIRNAILWIVRNYPEIKDVDITKLLPTTKNTVNVIRSGTYWDVKNLVAKNPVLLGLCTEEALNQAIETIHKKIS